MVQVDVFWSFALGAGFASCAGRQLRENENPFQSPYFVKTLLYLSIFFVPSGAILLWGFPEWETMQAGSYKTIPAWLVGAFTMTNVTQGIIGFWVAYKFIRMGKLYWAHLLWVIGYFLMFFILVHGWDGMGYQRFFYSCSWWGEGGKCTPWLPGTYSVLKWAISPVALTLYAMGTVMLPLLFYWMATWVKEGYELAGLNPHLVASITKGSIAKIICRIIFLETLGSAIGASLLIRLLGWHLGILSFAFGAYVFLFRRRGLIFNEISRLTLEG
ncbi:MAG: hypothetical protein QXS68_08570 [Candidatus Methanomethylicaceae archaeon]